MFAFLKLHVQANGVGGSWWRENFCSGDDDQSINIVMTELQDTLTKCVRSGSDQSTIYFVVYSIVYSMMASTDMRSSALRS